MSKYFKINLEFDAFFVEETIKMECLKNGYNGYICFVDMTSLVHSYRSLQFRSVLNSSRFNFCDGSYIALLASILHRKHLKTCTGPDFFTKFIRYPGIHVLVGNKKSVFEKIIGKIGVTNEVSYHHIELPFCNVEDFDYSTIAKNINKLNPNFIWVSLGAPKQEIFMKNIEKYINNGTLFGVGAAFNFFSGEIQNIPKWVKTFKLIWIQRLLLEPKKQKERIITIIRYLPKILLEEIQEIKKRNKNKTSL